MSEARVCHICGGPAGLNEECDLCDQLVCDWCSMSIETDWGRVDSTHKKVPMTIGVEIRVCIDHPEVAFLKELTEDAMGVKLVKPPEGQRFIISSTKPDYAWHVLDDYED